MPITALLITFLVTASGPGTPTPASPEVMQWRFDARYAGASIDAATEPFMPPPPPPRPRPNALRQWEWPVHGPITNVMSPKHPLGIDIGLAEMPNSPIQAVADGTVIYAGGDMCCSYGLYVVIEHRRGIRSLYAHLSRIDVAEGEVVNQGNVLGLSGNTGRSTADHLHFEMHRGEVRLDPMRFLPSPCDYRNPLYQLYTPIPSGCEAVPHVDDPPPPEPPLAEIP